MKISWFSLRVTYAMHISWLFKVSKRCGFCYSGKSICDSVKPIYVICRRTIFFKTQQVHSVEAVIWGKFVYHIPHNLAIISEEFWLYVWYLHKILDQTILFKSMSAILRLMFSFWGILPYWTKLRLVPLFLCLISYTKL